MVFHLIPFLAVGATKAVIKATVDAPSCDDCNVEKKKVWVGMRLVFICPECEPVMAVRAVNMGLKVLTLGVRLAPFSEYYIENRFSLLFRLRLDNSGVLKKRAIRVADCGT
jgi:hypothetical protein